MAKFVVLRRVDAYVLYQASVEADTPKDAAEKACEEDDEIKWLELDTATFDARSFTTLDDEGNEIDDTTVGDL